MKTDEQERKEKEKKEEINAAWDEIQRNQARLDSLLRRMEAAVEKRIPFY